MSVAIAHRGRLPGIVVDVAVPRPVDDRIRLDVAGFVGFAERGPVDDPRPVEDLDQFEAIFGGDLELAVDDRGTPVHAALPAAVRAFFGNGGRRAYVVRVTGSDAVASDVPVRVIGRRPLGAGRAVVGLTVASERPSTPPVEGTLTLRASSPGRWGSGVSVDADVVDTVLALVTGADGEVHLTASSVAALEGGDALLVERASGWQLLWVPGSGVPVAPPGGWETGDVARLLRVDLVVRRAASGGAVSVERLPGLRLGVAAAGSAGGRSASWVDVLQPAGGDFRPDGSMLLRAPQGPWLVPVVGDATAAVEPPPSRPVPAPATRAALELDGLASFDPVALFLDPALAGRTVEGLRSALEAIGLEDAPHLHGVHALALVPEVAVVAVPDAYHLPWSEQAVLLEDADVVAPPEAPDVDAGAFDRCDVDPPSVVPPASSVPPAVLRFVTASMGRYDPAPLHAVAGAVADLCAARADVVAVLGAPRHAGVAEVQDLAAMLRARRAATTDVASHVGIWHPWVAVPAPGGGPTLRPVPPDGSVCGSIAAAELARGLWVAPAGIPLAGVVAVDRLDGREAVTLFDRGCNVLGRRPAGVVASSAHTLSGDRSLLQLSVRRLLIWVRELLLRDGARFVFEPDDERFRAAVATTVERPLERLRVAGALAAYQVEVEPLAGRPAAEDGRVVVAVKLAPTTPIEFVTVTLLRAGEALRAGGS